MRGLGGRRIEMQRAGLTDVFRLLFMVGKQDQDCREEAE